MKNSKQAFTSGFGGTPYLIEKQLADHIKKGYITSAKIEKNTENNYIIIFDGPWSQFNGESFKLGERYSELMTGITNLVPKIKFFNNECDAQNWIEDFNRRYHLQLEITKF